MKFKRITLGIGFSDYWRNAGREENPPPVPAGSETNYKNLISLLIRLVKEQQSIIEQQQSDIAEMKTMISDIKSQFDVLVRIEAYQTDK